MTLAGIPFVGLFLGAVVWYAARSAATPAARRKSDEALTRACNELPFCDCR